jgi:uridine kinase
MSILIGIAGGTGSGKTSFARKLLARLGPERCLLIAQDAYYKDGSALDPAARAAKNYDHPDAFDTPLLVDDLRDLKAGRPVPTSPTTTRPTPAACSPIRCPRDPCSCWRAS